MYKNSIYVFFSKFYQAFESVFRDNTFIRLKLAMNCQWGHIIISKHQYAMYHQKAKKTWWERDMIFDQSLMVQESKTSEALNKSSVGMHHCFQISMCLNDACLRTRPGLPSTVWLPLHMTGLFFTMLQQFVL